MREQRLMTRARRVAASTEIGQEIFDFIRSPAVIAKLGETAAMGIPAAAAVSTDLLDKFSPAIREPAIKRRVGLFIAAVLDAQGFSVARANVRMKDPLFTTGAVYVKRPPEGAPDLISRLASALTEDEARRIVETLAARFPSLRRPRR